MQLRPPILSRRFLAVLRGALEASPKRAAVALAALVRGKKLRAWNLLCSAAIDSPRYYDRWVVSGEPAAIARWSAQGAQRACRPGLLVIILAGPDATEAGYKTTQNSVQRAFGEGVPIFSAEELAASPRIADPSLSVDGDDWLFPIRAGDSVSSELGAVLAIAIEGASTADVHYWDEDRLRNGQRCEPWIKPDWDDILFSAQGGLLGAAVVRKSVGLDLSAEPVREMAVCCEAIENRLLQAARLGGAHHIPLILSHISRERSLVRAAPPVEPAKWPAVSIIIPMRDKPELLRACLSGLDLLDYPGCVDLIIVDNGSRDPEALRLLEEVAQQPGNRIISMPGPFNFSRLNNAAVKVAKDGLLCLLNNDIEPLDGSWLTAMVRVAVNREVGAVGALLLYPDRTVQHAGVGIGLGGAAGHIQRGVSLTERRHWHWAFATRQVSAVTAACLVVDRAKYIQVGGLDEAAFAVAFNDVDLCLKLDAAGWKNIYVAEACLIHHESKSRGQDDVPEKAARFQEELRHLQAKWQTTTCLDPHFSPLFSRASEQCVLEL